MEHPIALPATGNGVLSASTMVRLEPIADRREEVRAATRAPRTIEAYLSAWRGFAGWAESLDLPDIPSDPEQLTLPIPVGVIEAYILERSDPNGPAPITAASIALHLSALRWWHHAARLPSPTDHPDVTDTLAGIRRSNGGKRRQVRPLYLEDVAAAVETLGDDPKGTRDRALLLVGWWGAFRRSELVSFDRSDVEEHPEGLIVTLRRSKTDQIGQGRQVPLHYHPNGIDPVRALRAWLELADGEGSVFQRVDRWGNVQADRLHHSAVARVVKAAATSIGIDPETVSGHSLRAGFVSECDRRRIPSGAVRAVTGHTSDAMLSVYSRPGDLFDGSAGAYFDA